MSSQEPHQHHRPSGLYLCYFVTLLSSALSFACGIAQSKYNWTLIEGSHVFDDLLRESSSYSCHTCSGKSSVSYMSFFIQSSTKLKKQTQLKPSENNLNSIYMKACKSVMLSEYSL